MNGRDLHSESETVPRVSVLMPMRDAEPWIADAGGVDPPARTRPTLNSSLLTTAVATRVLRSYVGMREATLAYAYWPPKQTDRGLVPALNRGLVAARAPLLARMDADDISDPRRLGLQADALDADPRLFAVSCLVTGFPDEELGDGMRRYLRWQNSLSEPSQIARDRFVEKSRRPSIADGCVPMFCVLAYGDGGRAAGPRTGIYCFRAFEEGLGVGRVSQQLLRWRMHAGQATRKPRVLQRRRGSLRQRAALPGTDAAWAQRFASRVDDGRRAGR